MWSKNTTEPITAKFVPPINAKHSRGYGPFEIVNLERSEKEKYYTYYENQYAAGCVPIVDQQNKRNPENYFLIVFFIYWLIAAIFGDGGPP